MILTSTDQTPSGAYLASFPLRSLHFSRRNKRYGRRLQLVHAMVAVFLAAFSFVIGFATMGHAQEPRAYKLVALGDSLTAGYNLPATAALPAVLQELLKAKGVSVEIANAGVSGDTTQGGLDRLDWSVPDGTDGVILALGANDMLRGLDPAGVERNLEAIITRLKARNIPVMLSGMLAGRNLGPDYTQRFDAIYPRLAEKYGLILHPFLLDGVTGDEKLTMPDRLHPTADGVRAMAERLLPFVQRFLTSLPPRS